MEQTPAPPRRRRFLHALGSVLLGFVLAIAVAIAALLIFVFSGAHSVAASAPESDWKVWLLDTAMTRSVEVHAREVTVPEDLESPERARAGQHHYESMCVPCHGGVDSPRSDMARAMTPTPPPLEHLVAEWSPAETWWIVRHGIEQTGMPAWGTLHSDEELWNIVAYMEAVAARGINDQAASRKEAEAPKSLGGGHDH